MTRFDITTSKGLNINPTKNYEKNKRVEKKKTDIPLNFHTTVEILFDAVK